MDFNDSDFDDGDFTGICNDNSIDNNKDNFTKIRTIHGTIEIDSNGMRKGFSVQDLWDEEVIEMINPYRKLTYEYVKLIELHTLPVQKEYMMRKLWVGLLDIVCLIEKRAEELDKLL